MNARNNEQNTPLMISVFAFCYADLEAMQRTIELLANADAELDAVNWNCDTALTQAFTRKGPNGDYEMHVPAAVQIALIEAGKIRYACPCAMW